MIILKTFYFLEVKKLNQLILPKSAIDKFLNAAEKNSIENLETGALLSGIKKSNQSIITHLLIPQQIGTEDEFIDLCGGVWIEIHKNLDISILGWIHTHLTQGCFFSSVDVHMQCTYQKDVPEFVGIVCAIKAQQIKAFRYPDHKIAKVESCSLQGFHPDHSNDFERAVHIMVDNEASVNIVNLRFL